jgi:SPP1 gp7 family putative phage head morphogenesis protein
MPRAPILPSSVTDPTGLDSLERRAIKQFESKLNQCERLYLNLLDQIQFEEITVNSRLQVNAKRYEFRTSPEQLINMLAQTAALVDQIMLEGGITSLWFLNGYVKPSYDRGTQQSMTNLSAQSTDYAKSRPSLESLFMSPAYQRRMGLLRAREFEEMKGLSDGIKRDMAQVLTEGLGRGLNPRDIADNIKKQTGIEQGRANRIARTEIPQAFKTARRDESREAMNEFGFRILMLHVSAMSPTTRESHARRNGELHTIEEQQDWYAQDGNQNNCKCSEIEQILNDKGEPLSNVAIDKARSRKLVYAGSNKD